MKISVTGLGYVGLSNALSLAVDNEVVAFDIDSKKIKLLKKGISPISETAIQEYLLRKELKFFPTTLSEEAYLNADYCIVATPTNFDEQNNFFDTSSIDQTVRNIIKVNQKCVIVIKSTVPIGYTNHLRNKFNKSDIIFSPEFLREGSALEDTLNPSRIIVGDNSSKGKIFAELLNSSADKKNINILLTGSTEAEAIKLFSNAYLAMRVSFFNELDSFSIKNNLNAEEVISGVSLDERIGFGYNNPSFGYGGYCLPKDTKQLLANYKNVPQKIIESIVDSNVIRKSFIVSDITKKLESISGNGKNKVKVGIFRLLMKSNSDNFRESAVFDIMNGLQENGIEVIVFEPMLKKKELHDFKLQNNLEKFKCSVDLIVANRVSDELKNVLQKVYSRDIFQEN